jgi:hypothetical protein
MPRLNKTDEKVMEEFGFQFSSPPENAGTRSSRYDEMWEAARNVCMKFPGQSLLVITYDKPSQPYNTAKAINNGEHRSFKDDSASWTAVARKFDVPNEDESVEPESRCGIWLTYNGEASE